MLKRILNLELITIPLCLPFSTSVVRKIMEFLLSRIWYYNRVVQTLDYNSMWLTSDVNKTRLFIFFNIVDLYGSIIYWLYNRTRRGYSTSLKFSISLWFYSLVFRTLDFKSKSLSSNVNTALNILLSGTLIISTCYPTLVKTVLPNYRLRQFHNFNN